MSVNKVLQFHFSFKVIEWFLKTCDVVHLYFFLCFVGLDSHQLPLYRYAQCQFRYYAKCLVFVAQKKENHTGLK